MQTDPQNTKQREIRIRIPALTMGLKGRARLVGITVAVSVFALLSGSLAYAANLAKDRSAANAVLTEQVSNLATQVTALEGKLGETEEGRKQLEEVNESLEAEKESAEGRAETAEQQAVKASLDLGKVNAQLATTQSSLQAKKAELDSAASELVKKQSEIAVLDKCVVYFDKNVIGMITGFDDSASNSYHWLTEAAIAAINDDQIYFDYSMSQLDYWNDNTAKIRNVLDTQIDQMKSRRCGN